jgi:hypothetical protein
VPAQEVFRAPSSDAQKRKVGMGVLFFMESLAIPDFGLSSTSCEAGLLYGVHQCE